MVSRLDGQKGLDLMVEAIHRLMGNYAGEAQFVLLGSGDPHFEQVMGQMAHYHPSKMKVIFAYRADLAPLIYGGSDMFLMPSRFEPCGLGQLIAMRYGSVPIVRATGGLADTVTEGRTGFLFSDYSANAFWDAIGRAIYVYNVDKPRWAEIQLNGMAADFSWERSAKHYQTLYEWALTR
jgi:starch synthase